MIVKNLLVTFNGDNIPIIEEVSLSAEDLKKSIKTTTKDRLLVSIVQVDPKELTEDACLPPVQYHLHDSRTTKNMRGNCAIITTHRGAPTEDGILDIEKNFDAENLIDVLHRKSQRISLVLKKIERKYVEYTPNDTSPFVFDVVIMYHGLSLLLIKQKVCERPKQD